MSEALTRVLIVDDEPSIRQLMEMVLRQTGWHIDSVASAEDAEGQVAAEPYDLYLVDKNLPGKSGVDFVRWLRDRDRVAAILMITAHPTTQSALDALGLGIDGYLPKPLKGIQSLLTSSRRAVARGRARRADALAAGEGRPLSLLAASSNERLLHWLRRQIDLERDHLECVRKSHEALRLAQADPPELLLLDARLESPDVYTLISALDESVLGSTFVIMNDDPKLEDVLRYIDLGVRAVLERPMDAAEFDEKVGSLIRELRLR